MATKNKLSFVVKVDDKDLPLYVSKPSPASLEEAQLKWNSMFTKAAKSGAILNAKLMDLLRKQELWDDDKQKELDDINADIDKHTKLLMGKGNKLEARKWAIEIKRARLRKQILEAPFNSLQDKTCESQADNYKFGYLVSACTRYGSTPDDELKAGSRDRAGELYFKDHDDFLAKKDGEVATDASLNLMYLLFGVEKDWQKTLPENQFLSKYGYVNSDYILVNMDGKPCDEDFNEIVEEVEDPPFVLGEFTD